MTGQDWLAACAVAAFVAALTVAMTEPPACWAGADTPERVPALPPVELTLSSIHAQVSASAVPAPGKAVEVTLAVKPTTAAGSGPASVASRAAKAPAFSLPAPLGGLPLQSMFGEAGIFNTLFARLTPVIYRVPVTVTVLKTDMNMMARSMPEPEQVMQLETSVPIGPGGAGAQVVTLPLTWAEQEKPAAGNNRQPASWPRRMISYQLMLSSPLGGKAAPSDLRRVAQAGPRVTDKRL